MELVVAITGASGSLYARRLLEVLEGHARVHLIITDAGEQVIGSELDPDAFSSLKAMVWKVHENRDIASPIASGSVGFDAMVIIPCSMNTAARLNAGIADDLVCRAGAVAMKEGRKLIILPRESPLSSIHLRVLSGLADASVMVMPLCPGLYKRPATINELVDGMVQRVLDQLGLDIRLVDPYG